MNIGTKMRTLRMDRGLTSVELAQLAGTTQSTISDIENDNRSPQLSTLAKICNALNVPIMEVLPVEHHLPNGYSLSEEEKELIDIFHKMSCEQRTHFISLFKSLLHE